MDAMDPVHLSSKLMMNLNNAGGAPAAAEGTPPEETTKLSSSQEDGAIDVVTELLLPRSTDEELLMQLWDLEHPGLLRQFGIELEEAPDSCELAIREQCLAPGVACFVVFPDHHDDDDEAM